MNREELLLALKTAEPALASKGLYPILENFCFDKKAILAFDDQLSMRVPYSGGLGQGCLPGKTLLGFLSASGAAEAEVAPNGDSAVKLKLGRSRAELPLLPLDDFTKQFQEPDRKEARLIGATTELMDALERASVSLGWDSLQAWTYGVTLAVGKKRSFFYATNNFSLARVAVAVEGELDALLPPRFVETLLKQHRKDPVKHLLVWDAGDWVGAEFGNGAVLYCRTTPQADPGKYQELFKELKGPDPQPVPKGLEGSLERAKVFLTSPIVAERTATFRVARERLLVEVDSDRGNLRDVHKFPGHPDVALKAPPELISAALRFADRMAILPDKAVRLEGEGLTYIVSGAP